MAVLLALAAGAYAQTPPVITVQPASRAVTVGAAVSFSVTATGNPAPTYQWRRNGIAIAGATAATYTLASAPASFDGHEFSVVVANVAGSATSVAARLTVNDVAIVNVGGPGGVAAGQTATFTTSVSNGTPPFTYQWYRGTPPGGTLIPGATGSSYTTPATTVPGDDGSRYYVTIRDASGITSVSNFESLVVFPESQTIAFTAPVNPVVGPSPVPLTATATSGLPVSFAVVSGGPAAIVGSSILFGNVGPVTIRATQAGSANFNPAPFVDRTVTVGRGTPVITWSPPASVAAGTVLGPAHLNATANVPGSFTYSPPAGTVLSPPAQTVQASFTPALANLYTTATTVRTMNVVAPAAAGARITNLSVRAGLAAAQTLIVGFAMAGGARTVLIRGVGPTLTTFAVPDAMADPRLTLFRAATVLEANDNWGGGAALASAFAGVGAFALPPASLDAALMRSVEGAHTAQVTGGGGTVLVEVYATGAGASPRLTNVSARNHVGTGGAILIAGVTIEGAGECQLLVRGVGPALTGLGVTGALADPRLEIFSGSVRIADNDTWAPGLAGTFAAAGAFALPAGSGDAALTVRLAPGSYTVQVAGADGGTGEGLVEIYELP